MSAAPPPVRLQEIRLRIPMAEWAGVKTGHTREVRFGGTRIFAKIPYPTPTPAIAYTRGRYGDNEALIVIERTWLERLGEIQPDSLEAMGLASVAEFRQRWVRQHGRFFRPLDTVRVYRLRPFTDDDRGWAGELLLNRLYGRLLDGLR